MDSKGADQDAKVTHRESTLGAQGAPQNEQIDYEINVLNKVW